MGRPLPRHYIIYIHSRKFLFGSHKWVILECLAVLIIGNRNNKNDIARAPGPMSHLVCLLAIGVVTIGQTGLQIDAHRGGVGDLQSRDRLSHRPDAVTQSIQVERDAAAVDEEESLCHFGQASRPECLYFPFTCRRHGPSSLYIATT